MSTFCLSFHKHNLDRYSSTDYTSWFGIPSSDPQGPGPDQSYGQWQWGGGCVPVNNPKICNTNVTSSEQRWVASKRRPLAGLYSAR